MFSFIFTLFLYLRTAFFIITTTSYLCLLKCRSHLMFYFGFYHLLLPVRAPKSWSFCWVSITRDSIHQSKSETLFHGQGIEKDNQVSQWFLPWVCGIRKVLKGLEQHRRVQRCRIQREGGESSDFQGSMCGSQTCLEHV